MGRYVPPDQEGLTTGNKLAGKHPLGARARHLRTTGALIVRFEMPFAVWCTNCKPHDTLIGQGVRFNAEKKKVGNYYSTPIYSFRMKHTACGGWIEIRTDPKNTAYVVTEGGRKRDTGDDRIPGEGEIRIRLPGVGAGEEGKEDPFARLEGKIEDKKQAETATSCILELKRHQDRYWEDPYEKSRMLRRAFRVERKSLERADANREALKDKMSLGIDLVDETEEDRLRAGMVDFGGASGGTSDAAKTVRLRPMFESMTSSSSSLTKRTATAASGKLEKRNKRPKTANLIAERKAALRNELTGNTRAVVDPFLNNNDGSEWQPGIRRRKLNSSLHQNKPVSVSETRVVDDKGVTDAKHQPALPAADGPAMPIALVNYDSDSD